MPLKLSKIRQKYKSEKIPHPIEHFKSLLKSSNFNASIKWHQKIAIAVGSRGIKNIDKYIQLLVDYLHQQGSFPFIVPAMGSHGGATPKGQLNVLKKLGITEEKVKAPIISSMEVKNIGDINIKGEKYPVYIDKTASEADGIILINRVKHHTAFYGDYESGLVKMIVIGLGNHIGASSIHSLVPNGLKNIMPEMAKYIVQKEKILGGFCIIEDAYQETARIYWMNRDEIILKEPEILKEAKSFDPRLPIQKINLLMINQMGKNISGTGIDTIVVGRMADKKLERFTGIKIDIIGISNLTEESCGNAAGIGFADFITERLYKKIDMNATLTNVMTSKFFIEAKIPIVLKNDKEIINVAIDYFSGLRIKKPKIIVIKDTLHLIEMYVSEGVLEELKDREDIEIISGLNEVQYDAEGNLIIDF